MCENWMKGVILIISSVMLHLSFAEPAIQPSESLTEENIRKLERMAEGIERFQAEFSNCAYFHKVRGCMSFEELEELPQ